MTIEKIRGLCNAEPFRPFVLHLLDGREVTVKHPDSIAFFHTGRLLIVAHEDESESLIDPMLVSDITLARARTRRNGKQR